MPTTVHVPHASASTTGPRCEAGARPTTTPELDARTRQLLEGSIVGTLLRLATPNVLVMFVQASVGLIETYFVARLGTDALAGVTLVFPLRATARAARSHATGGVPGVA